MGQRLVMATVALLLGLSGGAFGTEGSGSQDVNLVETIQKGPGGVQIQVTSSRPFPVRALPPVLQIGSHRFSRSVRPPDGDLDTLIFLLEHQEFAQLRTGEPAYVLYGKGGSPRERWDLGEFRKDPQGRD